MKNKSKLDKFTPLVIGTAMLTLVTACGSDDDDNSGSVGIPQEEQTIEGTYRAVLAPIAPNATAPATGVSTITIAGDEFRATMNVSGVSEGSHPQNIHIGTSCPSAAQNTNGDTVLDADEASAAYGGALIPLDSDLRAQDAGESFPSGSSYNDYNESASLLAMEADLRLPDTDTSDDIVKLGLDDPFTIEGRVVVVYGTTEASPTGAVPVLCGPLVKIQNEDTGAATAAASTAAAAATTAASTAAAATSDASTSDASATSSTGDATTSDSTTGGETGTTTGTTSGTTSGETSSI